MDNLVEKKRAAVAEMEKIVAAADAESRALTEEERARFDALEAEVKNIADVEARAAKVEEAKKSVAQTVPRSVPIAPVRHDEEKEFRSFSEFIYTMVASPKDRRLQEYRAQSMGVGSEGGYAVPQQFLPELLSVEPQEAIFRPRARVIPAGSPPDAKITMPALNQGTAKGMYGGVSFSWIGEGRDAPETDMALREVELEPKELAGVVVCTEKLLRNWAAASTVITEQFRAALRGIEDAVFYNGNGVGKPLGVVNSPAAIGYTRAASNKISYADVVGMYSKLLFRGGAPVWIASQTTIPQLATIKDESSANLWVQSAAPGIPPTLLGLPVLFSERSSVLGNRGDLVLVNLAYYLIKDGSGPFISASEHVLFQSSRVMFKLVWNVDGRPWLDAPIPLEGSSADTISPFVVLV